MPQRKQSVRISTEQVQGEGSFILIRQLKGTEAYEYADTSIELKDRPSAEAYWNMVKCLGRLVIDWNWVNDVGNPLPKPQDDPEVLTQLTVDEINVIAEGIQSLFTDESAQIKN